MEYPIKYRRVGTNTFIDLGSDVEDGEGRKYRIYDYSIDGVCVERVDSKLKTKRWVAPGTVGLQLDGTVSDLKQKIQHAKQVYYRHQQDLRED